MKIGIAGSAFVIACLTLSACPAPSTPGADRPTARSYVLLVAEGVKVADQTCAASARVIASTNRAKAEAVADACAHGYAVSRRALLAAEAYVNAYESGGAGQWGCAVRDAMVGLREMGAAIVLAGVPVPGAVSDGLTVASALTGLVCSEPVGDAGVEASVDASVDAAGLAPLPPALAADGGLEGG